MIERHSACAKNTYFFEIAADGGHTQAMNDDCLQLTKGQLSAIHGFEREIPGTGYFRCVYMFVSD